MRRLVFVLFALCALAALWIVSPLSIREMGSDSMAPLISGQGSPPSKAGDYVLLMTATQFVKLKEGDLVLVEIPTSDGATETIRRIKSIVPGDSPRYILESVHPHGIDSRHFGQLGAEKIRAKVLHVFKS